MNLNEALTRVRLIDPQLRQAEWRLDDKTQVRREIDRRADFRRLLSNRSREIITSSAKEGSGVAEVVSADDFLTWAAGVGIGFDPRYPDANCLSLLPPRDSSRSWQVPEQPYPIEEDLGRAPVRSM